MSDEQPSGPPITAYEYDVMELPSGMESDEVVDRLDEMGAQGWRVVSVSAIHNVYRVWFMREAQ
jgi:hypothetical protein